MKKIYFIIISLLLVTGCKEKDIENFKELDLSFCDKFTIKEFEDLYFKDSSWDKKQDIYTLSTTTFDNEKIIMELEKDGIEAKVITLKVNAEKVAKKEYLSNMCEKAKILNKSISKTISLPVEAIYNKERYSVDGIPETAEVILYGSKEDLLKEEASKDKTIILDLSEYDSSVENYKLVLSYTPHNENLIYKLNPPEVSIKISDKVSKTVSDIQVDIVGNLPNNLIANKVELSNNEIIIKGSEKAINRVAMVKIILNLEEHNLKEAGTYKIENLPFLAYDKDGEKIDNIEFVPRQETVNITVQKPLTKKIKISNITIKNLREGFIANSLSSLTEIEATGPNSILESLSNEEFYIDLKDYQEGIWDVDVHLTSNENKYQKIKINKIKIKITKEN